MAGSRAPSEKPFLSTGVIEQVERHLDAAVGQGSGQRTRFVRVPGGRLMRRASRPTGDVVAPTPLLAAIDKLKTRAITDPVVQRIATLLLNLARSVDTAGSRPDLAADLAAWFTSQRGGASGVTLLVARSIMREASREALLSYRQLRWDAVWQSKLAPTDAERLLDVIQQEVEGHEEEEYEDNDLAFGIDLAKRIVAGALIEPGDEVAEGLRERASELLSRATRLYPAADSYDPPSDGPPDPMDIQHEIEAKVAAREPEDEASDDEV